MRRIGAVIRCAGTWWDLTTAPEPVARPCDRTAERGERLCAECLRQQRRLAELREGNS